MVPVNTGLHLHGYKIHVRYAYFTLGVVVESFSLISLYSFNFLNNSCITKRNGSEKCFIWNILIRSEEKRLKGRDRVLRNYSFSPHLFLIEFSLLLPYCDIFNLFGSFLTKSLYFDLGRVKHSWHIVAYDAHTWEPMYHSIYLHLRCQWFIY